MNASTIIVLQCIQRNLERYGVEWYIQTEDFKKKSISTLQDHYDEDIVNPFQATEVKRQIKDVMIDRYGVDNPTKNPDICRRAIQAGRATSIERYGTPYPAQNHEVMSKARRKYTYDNVQFDSFPELSYYIWLTDHGISFEYQPNVVFTYVYDNKVRTYHPDFKLVDTNEIIDIKCSSSFVDGKLICLFDRSLDGVYEAKHQCMLENNVHIMLDDEYMQYVKYVEQKFGKDFKNKCKNSPCHEVNK